MASVKVRVVPVGNSKGIRIPKAIIEQFNLKGEVSLETRGDYLVIRPVSKTREGWTEAFAAMAKCGDDGLLLGDEIYDSSRWDEEEWEW